MENKNELNVNKRIMDEQIIWKEYFGKRIKEELGFKIHINEIKPFKVRVTSINDFTFVNVVEVLYHRGSKIIYIL